MDGLIYGLAHLKFKEKEIGLISEEGLQPAGSARVPRTSTPRR